MPRGRPRKVRRAGALVKSAEFIGWALGGLEREIAQTRERLSALTSQAAALRGRLGLTTQAEATPGKPAVGRRRRRRMSREARKRISEMMKKRWAERKRGK